MAFTLKSYLPRSVYGRAALILILPVVFVQVVVSVIFIQRHFDGVTRQLSRGAGIEVGLLVSQIDSAADLPQAQARVAALAAGLRVAVTLPAIQAPPSTDLRAFWDLSGREVGSILHDALPQVVAVDLAADPRNVQLWVQTRFGAMRVDMSRLRVSASNPHQLLVIMALASILMVASGMGNIWHGGLLLFVYGAGMTAPFVVAALFAKAFLGWAARNRKYLGHVEKIMGAMLILFAILIATNGVSLIAQWMIETFPSFGSLG